MMLSACCCPSNPSVPTDLPGRGATSTDVDAAPSEQQSTSGDGTIQQILAVDGERAVVAFTPFTDAGVPPPILALMHRGYTGARYLERLGQARAAIDDLAVSTDIIVGFPGETDDDFERTLEVAASAEYDYAYTFIFSPRG